MSLDRSSSRIAILITALAMAACGADSVFDERLKTCGDAAVDLVNSEQTLEAVHIAGPAESFSPGTYLASGSSRRLVLCLERGDRKSFRAGDQGGRTVGTVTCVASKHTDQYEGAVARVVWGPLGFACENW